MLFRSKIAKTEKKIILDLSLNKPGKMFEFLNNKELLQLEKNKLEKIEQLSTSSLSVRMQYAKDTAETENVLNLFESWFIYFRNQLIENINNLKIDKIDKIKNIIKILEKINFLLKTTNINQKLALEIFMLEI